MKTNRLSFYFGLVVAVSLAWGAVSLHRIASAGIFDNRAQAIQAIKEYDPTKLAEAFKSAFTGGLAVKVSGEIVCSTNLYMRGQPFIVSKGL